jgi:predicted TIM-barrel fold metal-dependent hydrolase
MAVRSVTDMYIDVHHHMLTPDLVETLNAHGIHTIGGEPLPTWTPGASLAIMDRVGIQRAVLSCPIPLHFTDDAMSMARQLNEFAAECVYRQPERFAYFASLPLPDIEASVAEASRALSEGACGVTMLSNHVGLYQGDQTLDPLYEVLNRLHGVAFVHPTASTSPIAEIQPSQFEFGFDATRTIANLIINGTSDRFPDIRFVFTHSGSCVPSVAHKLIDRKPMVAAYTAYVRDHAQPPPVNDLLDQLDSAEHDARRKIADFYFDTALSTSSHVLDGLAAMVPTSHILLGTDFPFGQEIGLQYTLRGIERYEAFSEEDRTAVLGRNASELLGLDTPARP